MDDDQLAGLAGIKATLLLGDYAAVNGGKLTVVGAGWNMTTPEPTPFAIAMLFELPVTEIGEEHEFRLDLIDVDGKPVIEHGSGQPIVLQGSFGVPDDVFPVLPRAVITINHSGLLLEPETQMEWRLAIDGKGREDWRLPFVTGEMTE